MLERSVARPHVTRLDRIVLVALAAITPTWRNVLRVVQPETLLRWHRAGFKALWRWRSRPGPRLRIAAETVALIRTMARENALWAAERIRGELLKLGIKASKRTVQKYMRAARPHPPGGQRWSTFLRKPCLRRLGLRLLASLRLVLSPRLHARVHRAGHTQRRVRRNDAHAVTWTRTSSCK
ncbi:MAG: hypothetical protein ABSF69_28765 [Polyangiaceae bacterium]